MLLWDIFILFTRVALVSWGGGPASMALMQRETTAVGWVTTDEFADALAVGNALPGPIAPQVSAYIGYKIAGFPGAIAATLGTVLPATLLMLVMIIFFFRIKDDPNIKAMLTAVRPVVVGLLVWTALEMGRTVFVGKSQLPLGTTLAQSWDKILIAGVAFGIFTFTRVNPVFVIIGAAALGWVLYH